MLYNISTLQNVYRQYYKEIEHTINKKRSHMILVIASEKGGTGKTTIATNLAIMRALDKKDVLLVDADPQASSLDFSGIREEEGHKPTITCSAIYGRNLSSELKKLSPKFDDIIVDVGGRDSTSLRSALLAADILVVPFLPSQLDAWSIEKMDAIVGEVLQLNENLKTLVILNKVDTNPKILLSSEATVFATECQFLKFSNLTMGYRVSYRKAVAEGMCVKELFNKRTDKALLEITKIYEEVFRYA